MSKTNQPYISYLLYVKQKSAGIYWPTFQAITVCQTRAEAHLVDITGAQKRWVEVICYDKRLLCHSREALAQATEAFSQPWHIPS